MRGLLLMGTLLAAACGTNAEGERCNPLRATSDCDNGLSCVYPTGANCGVAYCCAVDAQGDVIDKHPNCRPDPAAAAVCGFDLAVASDGGPLDAGRD